MLVNVPPIANWSKPLTREFGGEKSIMMSGADVKGGGGGEG